MCLTNEMKSLWEIIKYMMSKFYSFYPFFLTLVVPPARYHRRPSSLISSVFCWFIIYDTTNVEKPYEIINTNSNIPIILVLDHFNYDAYNELFQTNWNLFE